MLKLMKLKELLQDYQLRLEIGKDLMTEQELMPNNNKALILLK